jgi:hypothetical protein
VGIDYTGSRVWQQEILAEGLHLYHERWKGVRFETRQLLWKLRNNAAYPASSQEGGRPARLVACGTWRACMDSRLDRWKMMNLLWYWYDLRCWLRPTWGTVLHVPHLRRQSVRSFE